MSLFSADGRYQFRSPFDGMRFSCSMTDIVDVILYLKPQCVLLPLGFYVEQNDVWQALSAITKIFVPDLDRNRYQNEWVYGIYYVCEGKQDVSHVIDYHQTTYSSLPAYLCCRSSFLLFDERLREKILQGSFFLESDQPASDACSGLVYSERGMIDLREKIYAMQFECIDPICQCPTCSQKLTRAYLHHLLEHTPLLCQRFLIQHNFKHLREIDFSI